MSGRNSVGALALAFSLAACAQTGAPAPAQTPASPALIAEGEALSERLCARCHAVGKTGVSPFDGAPPLRTLSERYPVESLDEAFAEGVLVGHPAMPEFRLQPEQIEALVAYLETIQTRRGS